MFDWSWGYAKHCAGYQKHHSDLRKKVRAICMWIGFWRGPVLP